MFERRTNILTVVFLAAGCVLLVRLAQVQLVLHDQLATEDYSVLGGDHVTDTVRGGIYTRWGTPLAVQAPSFDLGVHYSRLLAVSSEAPGHALVRRYIDEFLSRSGPAGYGDDYRWDDYGRPQRGDAASPPPPDAVGQGRYEYIWSAARSTESRLLGALEAYVTRRLQGESLRWIARAPTRVAELRDWRQAVSELTGTPREELTEKAEGIVQQVERIQRRVQRSVEERSETQNGANYVRIVEQEQDHPVALDVGVETAVAVRTQPDRFPELSVIESTARRYPNGALAPHLVGKVMPLSPESWRSIEDRGLDWTMATSVKKIGKRYRMDDVIGVSGIESACEDLLRGTRGYVTNWRAFKLLSVERVTREVAPEEGADVYLTLREDVQRAANEALAEAAGMADLEFTCGALAIVDVRDGSILAAASYPGYDLATFKDDYADLRDDPRHPLFFRARYGALPTGSVYKIITAIAALEEGAITPGTTFTCRHVETFAGRPFHCTSTYGHGPLSLVPAIEKSCNIYFYHTGLAVGGEALAKWGDWFGLNEPPGRVPVPRSTHGVVNLSIGQGGMQCTPIQVAAAMAAVANGGRLYKTHFFHHAQKPDGEQVRAHEPSFKQVTVSRATLDTVREGMRRVVEGESGTARYAGLNPYRVAGKTGTAETGIEDQYHAWFAGYAPHDDPKIAFAVVSERTPGHGGSHTAPIMTLVLDRIWDEVEAMP